MSREYTVLDAITDIIGAEDSTTIISAFSRFIAPYHIDTFTSGEIDIAVRKRVVFHAMEWPDRWRQYYFQSGILEHDPVVEALGQWPSSFTWGEMRSRRGLSIAGTEALNKIALEGWVDGLIVPLHRSGTHFGLVSLVALNHKISTREKAELTAVSVVLHDRLRHVVPKEGFRVPPAGLTPREIECISLIADGLSDIKAGDALGIRGSTVHEHAERAKSKLGARNRAELVALAVAFGIIVI